MNRRTSIARVANRRHRSGETVTVTGYAIGDASYVDATTLHDDAGNTVHLVTSDSSTRQALTQLADTDGMLRGQRITATGHVVRTAQRVVLVAHAVTEPGGKRRTRATITAALAVAAAVIAVDAAAARDWWDTIAALAVTALGAAASVVILRSRPPQGGDRRD